MNLDKKFIRFKLDTKWSADITDDTRTFNAYIIRNDGLELFNTPSFSNEIVFPHLGENSHFLGVQNEGLELSYSMLVKEVTMKGYRDFLA